MHGGSSFSSSHLIFSIQLCLQNALYHHPNAPCASDTLYKLPSTSLAQQRHCSCQVECFACASRRQVQTSYSDRDTLGPRSRLCSLVDWKRIRWTTGREYDGPPECSLKGITSVGEQDPWWRHLHSLSPTKPILLGDPTGGIQSVLNPACWYGRFAKSWTRKGPCAKARRWSASGVRRVMSNNSRQHANVSDVSSIPSIIYWILITCCAGNAFTLSKRHEAHTDRYIAVLTTLWLSIFTS